MSSAQWMPQRLTVEKIGGTSMSNYAAVRDNIFLHPGLAGRPYGRIFVVSAYGGITNLLLEHKKNSEPGVYAYFATDADDSTWLAALERVRERMLAINGELFAQHECRHQADDFITRRLDRARECLRDLKRLCRFGHFQLRSHLQTVRELLASLGEAHSAYNTVLLLQGEGLNARLVDLCGWDQPTPLPLDEQIRQAFADVDWQRELPIVTGYAHCAEGLMQTFDRGYSEMTFSRIASLLGAAEAIIHKEYHLSSADPRLLPHGVAVPIGRTNYDVADQLANLGMEAIHPKAARGLRRQGIPLRVKNTFEPEHAGTLIDGDYRSATPCVEIIAGRQHLVGITLFDQEMVGDDSRETEVLALLRRHQLAVITKDMNANSLTWYVQQDLKRVRRVVTELEERYDSAETEVRRVCMVSVIGSDMQVPGVLAKATAALSKAEIPVLALHQSLRQVDIQFILDESHYEPAVRALHGQLIEPLNHGVAICAA